MDLKNLSDADLVDVLGTLEDLEMVSMEYPAEYHYPILAELEAALARLEARMGVAA